MPVVREAFEPRHAVTHKTTKDGLEIVARQPVTAETDARPKPAPKPPAEAAPPRRSRRAGPRAATGTRPSRSKRAAGRVAENPAPLSDGSGTDHSAAAGGSSQE